MAFAEWVEGAPRQKVLLADDRANTRRGLARFLRSHGYEVVEANDAEEALRLFKEAGNGAFAVVLTDYNMGTGGSGVTLAREIRKHEQENGWTRGRIVLTSTDLPAIQEPRDEVDALVDACCSKTDTEGIISAIVGPRAQASRCPPR